MQINLFCALMIVLEEGLFREAERTREVPSECSHGSRKHCFLPVPKRGKNGRIIPRG